MKPAYRIAILAAIALIPVLPYVLFGYAGQDLPFHVTSWLELRDLHFVPGWSLGANFTLGDPHLLFYPPVSLYLGAFLTFLLPLKLAPAVFIWIAFLVSGLSMYSAGKPFLADRDRLSAAALYMLSPYLLTTSLVRFAAADLLLQAWLPLIVLWLYQAISQRSRRAAILLGALLGLSWLTDIPLSIVLLYGLLLVAAICAAYQRSLRPVLPLLAAELIAAALAAFYLLPIWTEQRWIDHASLVAHNPAQLLMFMPQGSAKDSTLLFVCWIFLIVQTALILATLQRRATRGLPEARFFATLALVSVFFQIPLSYALWHHLPQLRSAQFPFRFLPLIAVVLPLLLFDRNTQPSLRRPACVILAFLALLPFAGFLAMHFAAVNRIPLADRAAAWHRNGYPGAPEYVPITAIKSATPAQLPAVEALTPDCQVTMAGRQLFQTSSPSACELRLPVFFYPYWQASDESHHALTTSKDPTGLLLVEVPSGDHTITVGFHPASTLRTASAALSFFTLLLLAAWLFFVRPRVNRVTVIA